MEKINIFCLTVILQISVILCQSYEYQFHHPSHQQQQPQQPYKFYQQKEIEAAVENFNRQQISHLQGEILSVHHDHDTHQPHFDFAVNQNYSDLEKATEQFVNSGQMMDKQKTAPKVIKITKTVAVKVPVIKYVPYLPQKEIMSPSEQPSSTMEGPKTHFSYTPSSIAPYKEDSRPDLLKYMASPPKPIVPPAPSTVPTYTPHYSHQSHHTYENSVFDTRPFYVRDPHDPKTMIKYIPMPVYEKKEFVPYPMEKHAQSHISTSSHSISVNHDVHPTPSPAVHHYQPQVSPTAGTHSYHVQYIDSYPSSTSHDVYQPQVKYVYT